MSSSYYSSSSYQAEEETEENEQQEEQIFNTRDCILFAIDCSESMLNENSEGDIPIKVALESIRSTLLDKVDSRPMDQVGVILYGTREFKNDANKEHIYLLQTLDTPDAPRVKEIDALLEDILQFKEKYGSVNETFSIGDLFWICSDIFSKAPKLSTRRVFLITDNDDPTEGNGTFRKASIARAKDLSHVGVEITLFGLDKPDNLFDTNLFYKDIASFEEADDNAGGTSNTGKLNQLLDRVKTNQVKNRSEFRVPLQIAPRLTIGIRGYNMVIEQKLSLPKKFSTNAEQLQEVKSVVKWQCVDTNDNLTPIDIKLAYDYGGEKVVFTKDELKEIQTIRNPSILVLGFKAQDQLKAHHQISHPYFIYPDESQYEGSNKVFFAMVDSMIRKKKMAICSFVRRVNAMPKIIALLPQAEKLDENGNQIDPPGFQLIHLPYADEIRPIPPAFDNMREFVVDQAVETAEAIIEKTKMDEGFNPKKYENPYIRNHKNMIKAIALQEQNIEKPVDHSVPNYDFIESNLVEEIDSFKELVGLANLSVDDLTEYVKPKRKNDGDEAEGSKRAKVDNTDIESLYESGRLTKATNQLLKDYLTTVGIQPKKLKADLVAQVEGYLSVKQEN